VTTPARRRVFLTGAARGIGRAIATRFKQAGCELIVPGRAELDLSEPALVEAYLRSLDPSAEVLVNNAAQNPIVPISELRVDDWRRTYDVNVTAPLLFIRHFAPRMVTNAWGRIVNVSSAYSIVAREGRAAYSASKAALNALTRTAAIEFAPGGVLVNAICPGFVDTDLTRANNSEREIAALSAHVPLRRLATPEEIAEVVYFLASDANTYITGQTILADGGFSIR
jgi:3-oxoacyl-[acyl-carrier protein] reductase